MNKISFERPVLNIVMFENHDIVICSGEVTNTNSVKLSEMKEMGTVENILKVIN